MLLVFLVWILTDLCWFPQLLGDFQGVSIYYIKKVIRRVGCFLLGDISARSRGGMCRALWGYQPFHDLGLGLFMVLRYLFILSVMPLLKLSTIFSCLSLHTENVLYGIAVAISDDPPGIAVPT